MNLKIVIRRQSVVASPSLYLPTSTSQSFTNVLHHIKQPIHLHSQLPVHIHMLNHYCQPMNGVPELWVSHGKCNFIRLYTARAAAQRINIHFMYSSSPFTYATSASTSAVYWMNSTSGSNSPLEFFVRSTTAW